MESHFTLYFCCVYGHLNLLFNHEEDQSLKRNTYKTCNILLKTEGEGMNGVDYQNFYEQVGTRNGWNFDRIRLVTEGEQWDFYQEVTQRCTGSDLLLDIGTGGGEKLLNIAGCCLLLVGIDRSEGMIQTANKNLQCLQKENVRFLQMDAKNLIFPKQFFNVVSCRQAPFSAKEVAKVLSDDGVFLTQQVSEADKSNLKEAFGRGQSSDADGTLKNNYISKLYEAGFSEVQSFDYDAVEYYESYEDLIFLLKHTPIVPEFGQHKEDFKILEKFIKVNQTEKGIRTNSKRFLLIAKKSQQVKWRERIEQTISNNKSAKGK